MWKLNLIKKKKKSKNVSVDFYESFYELKKLLDRVFDDAISHE